MRARGHAGTIAVAFASTLACSSGTAPGGDAPPEKARADDGAQAGALAQPSPIPAFSDNAWPSVPTGAASDGAVWRTVRHETIAVHFALPPGANARNSRLPLGHPVIDVELAGVTAQITYSSGAGVLGEGLAQEPPTIVGLPIEEIHRDDDNTTVQYLRREVRVVKGWVRGAECTAEGLTVQQAKTAFAFCSTVRVPPPGGLATPSNPTVPPFRLMPLDATVIASHGVPMIYAGHFVAKILSKPCPSEAELRAAQVDNFALEHRTMKGGELLVGTSFATYQDFRYQSETSVWATRAETCCMATILESLRPPTEAQIEYVAHLCDGSS